MTGTARTQASLSLVAFEKDGEAIGWRPAGETITLEQGKHYVFGRNTRQFGGPEMVCRSITDNLMVARAHCLIEFDEAAGGWTVLDYSFNGTTVFYDDMAGMELLRRTARKLCDGDVIMLHEEAPGLLFQQDERQGFECVTNVCA